MTCCNRALDSQNVSDAHYVGDRDNEYVLLMTMEDVKTHAAVYPAYPSNRLLRIVSAGMGLTTRPPS